MRLGGLVGAPPIPFFGFVAFNVTWLVMWAVSVPVLRSSARAGAVFAATFLALAGMVNLVGHPLLALATGGYFPGLATSPIVGAAGVRLWSSLRSATRRR